MALLDKNGKPYRCFTQPNPLAQEQLVIDKSKLVLHNINAKNQHIEEVSNSKPIVASKVKDSADDFLEMLREAKKSIKEEAKPIELPVSEAEKAEPTPVSTATSNTILVHCLPAVIRERLDPVYQEKRKTREYLAKIEFEAELVGMNDTHIQILTNQKLDLESIIFPSKYKKDGAKFDGLNWWKITRVQATPQGFMMLGEITNQNFSF